MKNCVKNGFRVISGTVLVALGLLMMVIAEARIVIDGQVLISLIHGLAGFALATLGTRSWSAIKNRWSFAKSGKVTGFYSVALLGVLAAQFFFEEGLIVLGAISVAAVVAIGAYGVAKIRTKKNRRSTLAYNESNRLTSNNQQRFLLS